MTRRKILNSVDTKYLLKQVDKQLESSSRREFGKKIMSLGALSLLSGCSLTDEDSIEKMLMVVSRWNDRVQATLFDPNKLAPTYPESMITKPFPFNAYYDIEEVPDVDGKTFKLELSGLIADRRSWTLEQLALLPKPAK